MPAGNSHVDVAITIVVKGRASYRGRDVIAFDIDGLVTTPTGGYLVAMGGYALLDIETGQYIATEAIMTMGAQSVNDRHLFGIAMSVNIDLPSKANNTRGAPSNINERLRTLKSLFDRGLITGPEYDDRRKSILSEL